MEVTVVYSITLDLDIYIQVQQSRQLKPEDSEDEESPTYLLGEIKRVEYILEEIINPAARLFSQHQNGGIGKK